MAKILIIDDEAMVRAVISRGVRHAGHDAIEAVNGKEGVTMAKREKPDLVITDIRMPEQEGIQTIAELKAHDPSLPIIVVSGEQTVGGYSPLADAQLLGADSGLAKPFPMGALLSEIERLLKER